MKKLDVVCLTRQLNQLRMRNPELKSSQFKKEISKYVGYNMFANLLLHEGYAYSINGIIRFSPTPIHKSKVEIILTEAREYQNKYTKQYLERKREKREAEKAKKAAIDAAINLLKENGFLVISQESIL